MHKETSLRHKLCTAGFAATLCLVFFGCAAHRDAGILEGAAPEAFEQIGPITVYNRTTLFDFMDGEADVYFPFGFRLLYTRFFESVRSEAHVVVEIYDMGSGKGSSGVYSHYSAQAGSAVTGIGESAWSDGWLLLFTRGRYFVRISPDPSPEDQNKAGLEELTALAGFIDNLL